MSFGCEGADCGSKVKARVLVFGFCVSYGFWSYISVWGGMGFG